RSDTDARSLKIEGNRANGDAMEVPSASHLATCLMEGDRIQAFIDPRRSRNSAGRGIATVRGVKGIAVLVLRDDVQYAGRTSLRKGNDADRALPGRQLCVGRDGQPASRLADALGELDQRVVEFGRGSQEARDRYGGAFLIPVEIAEA